MKQTLSLLLIIVLLCCLAPSTQNDAPLADTSAYYSCVRELSNYLSPTSPAQIDPLLLAAEFKRISDNAPDGEFENCRAFHHYAILLSADPTFGDRFPECIAVLYSSPTFASELAWHAQSGIGGQNSCSAPNLWDVDTLYAHAATTQIVCHQAYETAALMREQYYAHTLNSSVLPEAPTQEDTLTLLELCRYQLAETAAAQTDYAASISLYESLYRTHPWLDAIPGRISELHTLQQREHLLTPWSPVIPTAAGENTSLEIQAKIVSGPLTGRSTTRPEFVLVYRTDG